MARNTALILAILTAATAGAQDRRDAPGDSKSVVADIASWPLETVRTADGKEFRGLIQSQEDGVVEFVEVVRPRGKPMFLVVRPIDARSIASSERLPAEQQAVLRRRVQQFRFRSRIEAGRMDQVELREREQDKRRYLRYQGRWFTLDSTADDETTRRCVVRIEQIFRAYRQLLPPRRQPSRQLRVLLLGSMDEYHDFLRRQDVEITNPAFYSDRANLIVAASELTRFSHRLEQTRRHHNQLRRQYEQINGQMPKRLAKVGQQLRGQGVADKDVDKELDARRALWQSQYKQTMLQLNTADRRNEAKFAELTEQMFERLYHEGFHAYLENYVYPHDEYDIPVWLNEGLAQVFQNGRLEADTLRVDAPRRSALAILHKDFEEGNTLPLESLLAARRRAFLVAPEREQESARFYAYAWAMAYYLTFYEPILGSERLDGYVANELADAPPAARFEVLVSERLADFQPRWQQAVKQLKPPPK